MSERRYDDQEVQEILRRAAQLPAVRSDASEGLSLADLKTAAEEAGLDVAAVEAAARGLDAPVAVADPGRLTHEWSVPGAVRREALPELVASLRAVTGTQGVLKEELGAMVWYGPRPLGDWRVSVYAVSGATRVTVSGGYLRGAVIYRLLGMVAGVVAAAALGATALTLAGQLAALGASGFAGLMLGEGAWRRRLRTERARLEEFSMRVLAWVRTQVGTPDDQGSAPRDA